jgi:hypothetical protein
MGRILDKVRYEIKDKPVIQDYFIGTDSQNNGKTVNFEMAAVISTVAGQGQADRIVSGRPVWIPDTLSFYIPVITYYLQGQLLYTEPITITLDAADTFNPRTDVIAVTIDSEVYVEKGTPAPDPAKPTLPDGNDYLELTFVDIAAGGLVPSGALTELIYNEFTGEPNEYTATETTANTRIKLGNETNPFKNTKCIYVKSPNAGDRILFTNNTPTTVNLEDSITLAVRLDTKFALNARMFMSFYKAGSAVSDTINIINNSYNFNTGFLYDYQLISIPFSAFTFNNIEFDRINIQFFNLGGAVFRFDDINRVIGINQPPENEIYVLPVATASVLGGVKIGSGIDITGDGVISAQQYILPTATTTILGGVKIDGTSITIDGNGVISGASTYSLPIATDIILGGVIVDNVTITVDGAGVISATPSAIIPQDDGNGIGYVLSDRDNAKFTGVGVGSIDLTINTAAETDTDYGVTSEYGFSTGLANKLPIGGSNFGGHQAHGYGNTVQGYYGNMAYGAYNNITNGYNFVTIGYTNSANMTPSIGHGFSAGGFNDSSAYWNNAIGFRISANSKGFTGVGLANTIWGGTATAANRPAFTVGIGDAVSTQTPDYGDVISRKDGLVVRFNAEVVLPETTIAIIDAEVTGRQAITREYLEAQNFTAGETVNQVAHGFIVGDALRHNGTIYVKGQADTPANAGVIGVVTEVVDVDNFKIQYGGIMTTGTWTVGTDYFLSNATAGLVTTEPVYSVGEVRQYIGTGVAGGLLIEVDLGHEVSDTAPAFVAESLFDAQSLLLSIADNSPFAQVVPNSSFVGRKATGDIGVLTVAETKTELTDRLLENATVTGSFDLDYVAYDIWNITLTGATTLTESNLILKTILIRCTGDFALTYPANWSTDITGVYDGTVQNLIVIQYFKVGVYKVQIIQPS